MHGHVQLFYIYIYIFCTDRLSQQKSANISGYFCMNLSIVRKVTEANHAGKLIVSGVFTSDGETIIPVIFHTVQESTQRPT